MTSLQTPLSGSGHGSRPTRPARPNHNLIHSRPLPLETFPLPPLVPHNPFSLLQIAISWLAQLLSQPSSRPKFPIPAFFSLETRSVYVQDEQSIRVLWESGFFGKGSLSRSEPSWLDREKRRKGIIVGETSEEVTRRRREERRLFKNERARKEREAIESRLREERQVELDGNSKASTGQDFKPKRRGDKIDGHVSAPKQVIDDRSPTMSANASSGNPVQDTSLNRKDLGSASSISNASNSVKKSLDSNDHITGVIENQEHLQLTTEEAFFLSFGLGVLNVQNPITCETFSLDLLFSLFRQASYFPPRTPENVVPDDPFLLSYVVYHHFRSVGWVVRPGVKFAVDYLLYNRGPVFSHAEFAVIILPSYSQPYWHETKERKCEVGKREKKNWWWLHCVNRVQAQVRKSLVLAYVEIPPPAKPLLRNPPRPSSTGSPLADRFISLLYPSPKSFATSAALPVAGEGSGCGEGTTKQGDLDVRSFLKRYKVREITLKRWIPNRSRD